MAKRPAWRRIVVDLKVYPFSVIVSFCEKIDTLSEGLKQVGIKQSVCDKLNHNFKSAAGCTMYVGKGNYVIRMKHYPDTPKRKGDLSHEIFHVVSSVMKSVGIKLLIPKSDEAYCYLIGFLTQRIYEELAKPPQP